MTSFSTRTIGFGGYILSVATVQELRNTPQKVARARGDTVFVCGTFELGDGAGGVYAWRPDSLDNDDGQQTIKPFDVDQDTAGRWRWVVKGDSAYHQIVTELQSHYNDPVYGPLALYARILHEEDIRFQGDQASIDALNAYKVSVTGQFTQTNASITELSHVMASATQAVADRTTTLEATVNDPTNGVVRTAARVTENASASANATTAVANRATALEATVNDPTTGVARSAAKINEVSNAAASATTAVANRTSALETVVNDPNTGVARTSARVTEVYNANADLTQAVANRTSTLEAQLNTSVGSQLLSRIANEENVRAYETGTLANRVSTVEANTGGGNIQARVQTVENAVADLNGKTHAYWSVTTTANGNRAQIAVHADQGGGGVDITGDVTIDGSLLVTGSVTYPRIADRTITEAFQGYNGGSYGGAGTSNYYSIISFQVDLATAGDLICSATLGQSYSSTGGLRPWTMNIRVNGNIIANSGGGTAVTDSAACSGRASLGPGSYTVELYWYGHNSITVYNGAASLVAQRAYK